MNKKQFVENLSLKLDNSLDETQALLETTVSVITKILTNGENVQINNLGTFEVKQRKEKILFNPTTKQKMLIPPKLILAFKPQNQLKQQYNQ